MKNSVIKVENLSKQYRLGEIGTGSIAHDLNRWWHGVRGKENPYLKIGEVNDRTKSGDSDYVWSLRDIGFSIEQGDAVGIIGRNGAGKSTLLKILSRVTTPTTGSVKVKGRIASLLEVGTGFHPDLSGRENIYLNGAILGMRKDEIKRKFDEIVDFAGVERYIDTPVKRYSSGMYVRLAFGVAAHLESEILIVDEVLAVGDAEFQKKCLGKMNDVSKGEGRTVLFVSHNMSSIIALTKKCIYLKNGTLSETGDTTQVINKYLELDNIKDIRYSKVALKSKPSIVGVELETFYPQNNHLFGKKFKIKITIDNPLFIEGIGVSFQIIDNTERACVYQWLYDNNDSVLATKPGVYTFSFSIPNFKLYKGNYSVTVHLAEQRGKTYFDGVSNVCPFNVDMDTVNDWGWQDNACVYIEEGNWDVEKLI